MSGNRPDLHTPQHDQWDQGGYCNNLVIDDDGCGTVCGYRAPRDYTPTDGEILTAVVLYRAISSVDAPPPSIDTLASPEETARYLGEYQRWLAAHDAKVRAEALREAAEGLESGVWPESDESGVKNAAREIHYRADRIEKEAGL